MIAAQCILLLMIRPTFTYQQIGSCTLDIGLQLTSVEHACEGLNVRMWLAPKAAKRCKFVPSWMKAAGSVSSGGDVSHNDHIDGDGTISLNWGLYIVGISPEVWAIFSINNVTVMMRTEIIILIVVASIPSRLTSCKIVLCVGVVVTVWFV